MSQYPSSPYGSVHNGGFNSFQGSNETQSESGASAPLQSWPAAYDLMDGLNMQSNMFSPPLQGGNGNGLSPQHAHTIHNQPQRNRSQSETMYPHQSSSSLHASNLAGGLPRNYTMTAYVADNTAPWVPNRNPAMFQAPARPSTLQRGRDIVSQSVEANLDAFGYSTAPRAASDGCAARPVSDSGYGTQRSARSIGGSEIMYTSVGSNSQARRYLAHQAQPQQHQQRHQQQPQPQQHQHQSQTLAVPPPTHNPRRRSRSTVRNGREEIPGCRHCDYRAQCASDLKKHLLKHEKNFMCDYPGCKRKKGFGTQNDLDRHQKTVHKININATKNFRCAVEDCPKGNKVWPRLDNFKSHLTRMHPSEVQDEENMKDLITRSEIAPVPHSDPDTGHLLTGIGSDLTMPPHDLSEDFTLTMEHSRTNTAAVDTPTDPQRLVVTAPMDEDEDEDHNDDDDDEEYEDEADLSASESNIDPRLTDQKHILPPRDFTQHPQHILQTYNEDQIIFFLGDVAANLQVQPLSGLLGKPNNADGAAVMAGKRSLPGAFMPSGENRKLRGSLKSPQEGTISRSEAIKGLRRLAGLLKEKKVEWKEPSGAAQRKGRTKNERPCTFSGCSASFSRECELTKHLKRHNRPYGCTFPKCKKSFGSKSDWKRHEISQHFQLEMWRCMLPRHERQCAFVAYTQDKFLEHLKTEEHDDRGPIAEQAEAESEALKCRVGRNGQTRFWCGFCEGIISLTKKGIQAWDERFRHIDEQHFKNGQRTLEWLCFEENKTKQELEMAMDRDNFNDAAEPLMGEREWSNAPAIAASAASAGPSIVANAGVVNHDLENAKGGVDGVNQSKGTKRARESDEPELPRKKVREEYMTSCCVCSAGPYPMKLHPKCLCDHQFCPNCPTFRLELGIGESEIDLDVERYFESGKGNSGELRSGID